MTADGDRLRAEILEHLAARPGEWVPRRDLYRLTPLVTVHVIEGLDGESPFGTDDARGSAWDERRPDEDLIISVMQALRRELRTAERIWDAGRSEYLLFDDGELVGLDQIRERLGVERDTVDHWRHRGVLPEPDPADNKGRRARWRWGIIREWAVATKRGPA